MSLFGRILAAFRPRAESSESKPSSQTAWLFDWFGGRQTGSGVRVTPTVGLTLSAYFAAIRAISEDIAKLPLPVIEYTGRQREHMPTHPVHRLLNASPNDDMTAIAFRETMTHYALGWGQGVAEIEYVGGTPVALHPIHPSRVRTERNDSGALVYRVRSDDIGKPDVILESWRVLHIHGLGPDGMTGYGLSVLARETIGAGLAVEMFGSSFFKRGARLSGILEHPGVMGEEAQGRLRASWATMFGGAGQAHGVGVLEEGMKWSQLGVPPEEAQFLETRQHNVEEIARWFRMPPHKLQHLLRATFSNIEAQNSEYVTDTLTPWATRWEQEVKRKLLNAKSERALFVKHNFNALLKGTPVARSTYYRQMFGIGALSQNDIRALEDENPVEGGDTYYVPMNMRASDQPIEAAPATPATPGNPPGRNDTAPDDKAKALAPVFEAAASLVLRKEANALIRASQKHGDRLADFSAWRREFYASIRQDIQDAFGPPLEAWRRGLSSPSTRHASSPLDAYATEHIAESVAAIEAVTDVDAIAADWRSDRPARIAARWQEILRESE